MCNCKGNNIPKPTPVPIVVPEPTPEIDHFNNIDTIEPIDNGRNEGQAE